MMYVLIGLVVVLALVSGAEYAMLRVARAERKAEVAELKYANDVLKRKLVAVVKENKEMADRIDKRNSLKEGME